MPFIYELPLSFTKETLENVGSIKEFYFFEVKKSLQCVKVLDKGIQSEYKCIDQPPIIAYISDNKIIKREGTYITTCDDSYRFGNTNFVDEDKWRTSLKRGDDVGFLMPGNIKTVMKIDSIKNGVLTLTKNEHTIKIHQESSRMLKNIEIKLNHNFSEKYLEELNEIKDFTLNEYLSKLTSCNCMDIDLLKIVEEKSLTKLIETTIEKRGLLATTVGFLQEKFQSYYIDSEIENFDFQNVNYFSDIKIYSDKDAECFLTFNDKIVAKALFKDHFYFEFPYLLNLWKNKFKLKINKTYKMKARCHLLSTKEILFLIFHTQNKHKFVYEDEEIIIED